MSDFTAPRRRRPGSNPPIDSGGVGGPAPGKTTRTQHLPGGPATGFPIIDEKPLCEQEGQESASGCKLTESDRTRLLVVLQTGLITAMDNYRDAIQDARIEKLTTTEHGWGFLEEFLFYSLTGPLIGAATRAAMKVAMRGAAKMAETSFDTLTLQIAKLDEKTVQGIFTNASRGLRTHLKAGRTGLPEGNNGKAAFLQQMREGIKPFIDHMVAAAPTQWDDDAFVAIAHGYHDTEEHSVANYASYLNTKLASFDENRLDDVGQTKTTSKRIGQDWGEEEIERGRLVWVNGKQKKLALFSGRGGGHNFQRFIDPEWEQLALQLYRDRKGQEPDEMTMDGFRSNVRVGQEIEEPSWLDGLLGGKP